MVHQTEKINPTKRLISSMPDSYFKDITRHLINNFESTKGRTKVNRIRDLNGAIFKYNCIGNQINLLTLRKNSLKLAISEILGFLAGARTVKELITINPSLEFWFKWASSTGSLGGVYGDAFSNQYIPNVVLRLINNPNSTHARMTTLLPNRFPIPGNTYSENVEQNKFSLMPCLHSYHFLSDGEYLYLHATQASGDTAIGVFPHNCYQVQFMLILTAALTGLKAHTVTHHVHDIHIYENQIPAINNINSNEPDLENNLITLNIDVKKINKYLIRNKTIVPLHNYIDVPTISTFNKHIEVPVDF